MEEQFVIEEHQEALLKDSLPLTDALGSMDKDSFSAETLKTHLDIYSKKG